MKLVRIALLLVTVFVLLGACGGDDNHEPWPPMDKGGTDELTPLGSSGKGELVITSGGTPPNKPTVNNNSADAGADSN